MHNGGHLRDELRRYGVFLSLFLGAGFVAGSVVHFGEGVNTWDISILGIGVVLFVVGSVLQAAEEKKGLQHLMQLIASSLFLSLTVGMASGGTQHFIDTPAYSAWLIPLGITIGFLAFLLRQRVSLPARGWVLLVGILCIAGVAFHFSLLGLNSLLPDSLRQGHGSHSETHGDIQEPPSSIQDKDDGHKDTDVH